MAATQWQQAERVFLWYSPVWIAVVGVVVALGLFDSMDATGYMVLGATLAAPCVLIPWLALGWGKDGTPAWALLNLWVFIVGFWGNYAGTHYFYDVLLVRYTVPCEGYSWNKVPIVMFLMTHPYFCTYHIFMAVVMRKMGYATASLPVKGGIVVGLAYTTAILETWSISAFPHYRYPSLSVMLTIGSAFYSLFFCVTYPMFFSFWGQPASKSTVVATNALACCTLIYFAYESWTTIVGNDVYENLRF